MTELIIFLSILICANPLNKLSDDDFYTREAGTAQLKALGPLAWPALYRLAYVAKDAEVAKRAEAIVSPPLQSAYHLLAPYAAYAMLYAPTDHAYTYAVCPTWLNNVINKYFVYQDMIEFLKVCKQLGIAEGDEAGIQNWGGAQWQELVSFMRCRFRGKPLPDDNWYKP